MAKKHIIRIQNTPVEVTPQVYRAYYGCKRLEKTLWEKDQRNNVFLYSNLDTASTTGEEMIADTYTNSTEDIVLDKLMAEKLHKCIRLLSQAERELIEALYFRRMTERAYALKLGLSQVAILKRKCKAINKLRNFMKT